MQNLSQILGDVLTGSSMSTTETTVATHSSSSDTLAILEEAQAVIEGQTRASIPEPPSGIPTGILQKKESFI